jgi:hypothetical protein
MSVSIVRLLRLAWLGVLDLNDGRSKGIPDSLHLLGALVLLPRPEEASQTIALVPRHDVNVKVGNALAHAVIDSNKSAFGIERTLHRACEQLHGDKDRLQERFRQALECTDMVPRDDQAMPREQRAMVEESDASFALEDDGILAFSVDDVAKRALAFEHVLLTHQQIRRRRALAVGAAHSLRIIGGQAKQNHYDFAAQARTSICSQV